MSDVTITNASVFHSLTATTPDDPTAEIQVKHWNSGHVASVVLAAAAVLPLFSNANGISFGTSDGAITGSYTVPNVPAQSVQTQPAGNIAGAGFTSTTTAGTEVKGTQNSQGLSLAIPAYITTYAAQTVQTQASGAIPRSGFTTTTVAGDKIAGTNNTDGLLVAVPAYLTTAALSADSSKYAGTGFTSTTTAGTEIKATLNTGGLSMAVPAYLTAADGGPGAGFSAGVSGGNTSGDTGATGTRVVFAGGNNITLSQATNANGATITVSGPNTAAQTNQTLGLNASSNTTLTSTGTVDARSITVRGIGGISVGVSASQLLLSVRGDYLTTARASNDAVGLNTAQTNVTWTVNSSGISLNAGGYAGTGFTSTTTNGTDVKATLNNAGLSMAVPAFLTNAAGGPADKTVSVVEIMEGERLTTAMQWNNATYSNRPIFIPFDVDLHFAGCSSIRLFGSRSSGTVLVATLGAAIYSRVDSTSASRISSTSLNISLSTSAQWSGVRIYDITGLGALSLAPGRYVLGLLGSAAASNSLSLHMMGGDVMTNLAGYVLSGTNQTAATATNSHIVPFWGVYSATSAGFPANVALSEVSGGGSQNSPDLYAVLKAV